MVVFNKHFQKVAPQSFSHSYDKDNYYEKFHLQIMSLSLATTHLKFPMQITMEPIKRPGLKGSWIRPTYDDGWNLFYSSSSLIHPPSILCKLAPIRRSLLVAFDHSQNYVKRGKNVKHVQNVGGRSMSKLFILVTSLARGSVSEHPTYVLRTFYVRTWP